MVAARIPPPILACLMVCWEFPRLSTYFDYRKLFHHFHTMLLYLSHVAIFHY